MNNLLSARLQIDILRIQIACAAAKEYDAPWLEKSKSVMRDATGKFASKGSAIADDVKSTAKALKDATAISADVVGNLVKDKDFRHRAGLEPGLPGAKAIERVLAISKLSPGLEKKIDKWINEISQELADTYGEDGDALHQAIRKGGAPLPKNAALKDKLEFAVVRYKAYEDALKDPEKYAPTPKKQTDLAGGAINSVVPVAVSMAIALIPETFVSLFLDSKIKWGPALASAALGVAVDLAVQKGLDAVEIENPVVRTVASFAAGVWASNTTADVSNMMLAKRKAEIASKRKTVSAYGGWKEIEVSVPLKKSKDPEEMKEWKGRWEDKQKRIDDNPSDAIPYLDAVLSVISCNGRLDVGNAYYRKGLDCLNKLDELVTNNPDLLPNTYRGYGKDGIVNNLRASLHESFDNFEAAIEYVHRRIEGEIARGTPHIDRSYKHLADLYEIIGEKEEAIKVMSLAIEIGKKGGDAEVQALYHQGRLYLRAGMPEKAIENFKKVQNIYRLNPKETDYINELNIKNIELAIQKAEELVEVGWWHLYTTED